MMLTKNLFMVSSFSLAACKFSGCAVCRASKDSIYCIWSASVGEATANVLFKMFVINSISRLEMEDSSRAESEADNIRLTFCTTSEATTERLVDFN